MFTYNTRELEEKSVRNMATQGILIEVPVDQLRTPITPIEHSELVVVAHNGAYDIIAGSLQSTKGHTHSKQSARLISKQLLKRMERVSDPKAVVQALEPVFDDYAPRRGYDNARQGNFRRDDNRGYRDEQQSSRTAMGEAFNRTRSVTSR